MILKYATITSSQIQMFWYGTLQSKHTLANSHKFYDIKCLDTNVQSACAYKLFFFLQTCDEYGRWKINDNNHVTFHKNVMVQVHAHKTVGIVADYSATVRLHWVKSRYSLFNQKYSIITPLKYRVFENIIENGAFDHLNLLWKIVFFQCCLKIKRNDVMI